MFLEGFNTTIYPLIVILSVHISNAYHMQGHQWNVEVEELEERKNKGETYQSESIMKKPVKDFI